MIVRREKCALCNNAGTTAHMNFDDELIRQDVRVCECHLLLVHTMIVRREKCALCNNAGTTAHMNFDDELIRLMMNK